MFAKARVGPAIIGGWAPGIPGQAECSSAPGSAQARSNIKPFRLVTILSDTSRAMTPKAFKHLIIYVQAVWTCPKWVIWLIRTIQNGWARKKHQGDSTSSCFFFALDSASAYDLMELGKQSLGNCLVERVKYLFKHVWTHLPSSPTTPDWLNRRVATEVRWTQVAVSPSFSFAN